MQIWGWQMSEEPEVSPKKKKGKLPVIIALLAVLGGGGFFVMKSKAGTGPKKVEIKAGTTEPLAKEILVALSGGNSYLRVEVALELRSDFKKEELEADMPAIQDAVTQIFRSKSLSEVGAGSTEELKKEIGVTVNHILISHMKDEAKKAQAEIEKSVKDKPKPAADKKKLDDMEEEFVCPAGPVLNVYFTSFTTQ
jgi:flagellar basal body-associated protein FliL